MRKIITLEDEDIREGLRLIRAHAAAQHEYEFWVAQMAELYSASEGYILRDLRVGFERKDDGERNDKPTN